MVLSQEREGSDLLVAVLAGVVTSRDQGALVTWVRAMIRSVGTVRVLVHLTKFGGWYQDGPEDDVALWLQDDEAVSKMAIVGDLRWRSAVLTVIAQPLRRIPIEYFDNEAAARSWLGVERTLNASST